MPTTSVIALICREFHVSETRLRTGEDERFRQRTRNDELAAYFDRADSV